MYGQNYGYGQPPIATRRLNGPLGSVAGGFTKYKKWKNGFAAAGNLLTGNVNRAIVDGAQAWAWGRTHDYLREPRVSRNHRMSHGGMNHGYGGNNWIRRRLPRSPTNLWRIWIWRSYVWRRILWLLLIVILGSCTRFIA